MAVVVNATPLIALDAVVLDTETTGLDPGKARVVEIAAVRLASGRIETEDAFRRLVRPDEAIPQAATRIHGIDYATVADAPSFGHVWPEFSIYLGNGVLIGHSTGFDLAVLRRECRRIGTAWHPRWLLDIRLLAQLAEPNLPDHTLEGLAAWLNVEIAGRHSALGDATAAAKIFCALVPKLRDRGIRTLAEAKRASAGLTTIVDRQHRAGWVAPAAVPAAAAAARIDSHPYLHRAGAIMSAPARFVGAEVPLGAALERMASERLSSLSLFVRLAGSDGALRPEQTGIVTERDVLRALSGAQGAAALAMPVGQVASRPLITLSADAFAYMAIGRMNRLKIRHLGVTGDAGEVVGALTTRDLLRLRDEDAVELGDEIEHAADVHELGRAWAKLPGIARALVAEGLPARDVAAVISHQLEETTRRAAVLAEQALRDRGHGDPPCRYAFVVLGSAGRGESLLAMDQDNALVYADEVSDEAERWFETFGIRVAGILHQVGVPYCAGGVMAKNAQWRGSLATWRGRVAEWIQRSSPHDLLSVDIFFDLRGVHGDTVLADTLWRDAFDAAKGEASFVKLLVEVTEPALPALGWFGGFRTEQGRIDLKKNGLFGIVSAARALAICHNVTERSTPARLQGIKALNLGLEADLDALDEAHACFLELILKQQIDDTDHGRPPSNAVEIKRLSRRERERLRGAFRSVEPIGEMARDLLFKA